LHDLMWDADSAFFLQRMETFLSISQKNNIKVMFVFFDDCWYGNAQRGKQPEPVPSLHNSGWLQSPRYADVMNREEWPRLERYMKGVLKHFRNDERIILWDLYNEPANSHHISQLFPLLREVFRWAREVNPTQPVTVCKWKENDSYIGMIEYCIHNSDIVTFHNYGKYEDMAKEIANLKSFGKPVLCSEYMARGTGSTVENILPLLKKENIGAINWGFVDGKTQTKYYWDHPHNETKIDPWHHELFKADGTPYSQKEIDVIKKLTGK